MNEQAWVPFYFDSNMFSGLIYSAEDFEKVKWAYTRKTVLAILAQAKEATYAGTKPEQERKLRPKYGFRIECDGEPLRDFFERHNMDTRGL